MRRRSAFRPDCLRTSPPNREHETRGSRTRHVLIACALLLAALGSTAAAAEAPHGPGAPPSREQLRAAARALLSPDADEDSKPTRWTGFDGLPEKVRGNLLNSGASLFAPANGPDVRANNPAGDLTSEAQHHTSIAATGRFVVVSWLDTKGFDTPAGTPPSTWVGYAYSCDW